MSPSLYKIFKNPLRLLGMIIVSLCVCIANLEAQDVAIVRFAHAEYERNDPVVNATIVDQLLVRLATETPYTFVERVAIERVMAEQALTRVGFGRAESAARLGLLLEAKMLLSASVEGASGQPSLVTLEVVEPARAEVVARVQVSLPCILDRGRLAPLSDAALGVLAREAESLLDEGWSEMQRRPSQVLIKLIALVDLTQPSTVGDLGGRLEAAMGLKVAGDMSKRVLRTHGPHLATEENELRLLGLADAEDTAWSQFADHYIWGEYDNDAGDGPVIILHFWDGSGPVRDHIYPVHGDLDRALELIAENVLKQTANPTRFSAVGEGRDARSALGKLLFEKAKAASTPYWGIVPKIAGRAGVPEGLNDAQRFAAAAIFFDPTIYEHWMLLAGLLHDEVHYLSGNARLLAEVAAIEFQLSLLSRFLIGPAGVDLSPINRNRLPDRFPLKHIMQVAGNAQENFGDLYQGGNILNLRDWLSGDVYAQLGKAVDLLASTDDSHSDAFKQAAEFLIRAFLEGEAPPEITDKVISKLWPKLKLTRALRHAWSPTVFSESDRIIELLRDYHIQENHFAEARRLDVLTEEELAVALSLPPPAGTGAHAVHTAVGSSPFFLERLATLRSIAEANLRLQSASAPDVKSLISSVLNSGTRHVAKLPTLSDAAAAAVLLRSAAIEGDLAAVAHYLKHGGSIQVAGPAFLAAVRSRQWLVVEYLLDAGYDPAAAGPEESSYHTGPLKNVLWQLQPWDSHPIGMVALVELAWFGRAHLVGRLLDMGVALPRGIAGRSDSNPTDAALIKLISVGDAETLAPLLKHGAIPHPDTRSSRPSYLRPVILRKDLVMLRMLLAANARPQEAASGTVWGRGGLRTSTGWEVDAEAQLMEQSLTLAARQNWREGVEAMLVAPRLDKKEAFRAWPHQYAADPPTRARLLRATLEANVTEGQAAAPGINLACAIAENVEAEVLGEWRNPAARLFRARSGQSPLAFAIVENRPEIARLLVEAGAPLNDLDSGGVTPLAHAAALGDVELVQYLAAKGADLNLQSGDGNAPLGYAIYMRREPTALALLDLGASIRPPSSQPSNDPLFQAVRQNMPQVVERLLERGANPRVVPGGLTIFFPAAISNNPELIQRFVSLGCDVQRRSPQGWTPLMSAARWGADKSVEKLLALGLRDPVAADTAVDIIKNERAEMMPPPAALRALHYKPNYRRCLELFNEVGQIAASSAAQNRIFWDSFLSKSEAEVAQFLRDGGDVNFRGRKTPLQTAASHFGHDADDALAVAWVKFLLAHGAKTEVTGAGESMTPLMCAIYDGKTEAVRALLKHGAKVDARRTSSVGYYKSILGEAIIHPRVRPATVRVLLDYGAVIDADSAQSFEALQEKMPQRREALAAILSSAELDLLGRGRTRETARH